MENCFLNHSPVPFLEFCPMVMQLMLPVLVLVQIMVANTLPIIQQES